MPAASAAGLFTYISYSNQVTDFYLTPVLILHTQIFNNLCDLCIYNIIKKRLFAPLVFFVKTINKIVRVMNKYVGTTLKDMF